MADIKRLLDEVIEEEINNLDSLTDEEERTQAIRAITQLHKLRIDEIEAETEAEERRERRDMDGKKYEADRIREEASLKQQAKDNMIDRCVKIGIAVTELMVPLVFYGLWMEQGFRFEESGSFTSATFKGLMNRFKPTK